MTERWSSFFILSGVVLVALALWYLSYRYVRWDTRRKGIRPFERKAWMVAAVALPLFGCGLYLFTQVLRRSLTPPEETGLPTGNTDVFTPSAGLRRNVGYAAPEQEYRASEDALHAAQLPEPAWGNTEPGRSNGKSKTHAAPATARAPYQALRMRYSLVVIEGPLQGQQFLVKSLPVRIGRGEEVGIALDADLNVSRQHAEMYEWNGRLRIRDLGSMHGVLVNGAAANDQALSPGDRITMGGTVLVLRELP